MSRRDYAITRREDTINYTVKDVEEADEDEVFDIGDDLEVDLSGLTDMDGIRQRIIMHIEKVKGNYKDQVGRLACCQLHHRRRNWGQEPWDLAPPFFFCKVSPPPPFSLLPTPQYIGLGCVCIIYVITRLCVSFL